MQKKVIGVTARFNYVETNKYVRVAKNYLDELSKRDFIPIILSPNPNLGQILNICDGFLLIGGDDFDPHIYGQDNNANLSIGIEHEQDIMDKTIVDYAIKNQIPLLGICRGHQALSATQGCALWQDIDKAGLLHPCDGKLHSVKKINHSGLADLLPDEFIVNTYHHQAIKDLPQGFIPIFINGDIIEAIEHESLPIISVQWHPERLNTQESKIIFDYFTSKILLYK